MAREREVAPIVVGRMARTSPGCRVQKAKAHQGAGQVEQPLEQVCSPLVAHPEPAAAKQPGECALNHPAIPAQPLGGVDPPSSDARSDATGTQSKAESRRVIRLVSVQLGRALAGTARLTAWTDDRWDRVDQRGQVGCVVGVGSRETDSQGDAIVIHREVVLGARLAAIGRVGAGLLTPLFARTLRESTLDRDQSMAASSPNQLRRVSCRRCQTPAACQSRSRRQQVVPLPQPSSLGNSRHGHPVRRT